MTTSRLKAKQIDGLIVEISINEQSIENISYLKKNNPQFDALPWVTCGLFDLQVNGALGISFNEPRNQTLDISKAVRHCVAHGMTGILATLVTTDRGSFSQSLELLERTRMIDPLVEKVIEGYHIEGPAISPMDGYRGAHPLEHVRVPCRTEYLEWLAASNNRIKLITVAPELPGVLEWIQQLVSDGITVAIGHTSASSDQIRRAVKAGARLSTHLGNGCASSIDRHDNPIWPQLAESNLTSALIIDGYHIPEALAKSVLKCKGPSKIILTCDASPLAGLPTGIYSLWNKTLEIDRTGRVIVPDTPYLAGSGHFLDHCLGITLNLGEWNASEILDAATGNPRKLLGLEPRSLTQGNRADLVLWQGSSLAKSNVQAVCVSGHWYNSGNEPIPTFM